mgnify:FL=1
MEKKIRILGTRGIPAQHGGFETFAQYLALFLTRRGWHVTVYCQEDSAGETREETWQGVRRVVIPVARQGATGTILFDLKATLHALREQGVSLTLGYNTAIFSLLFRLAGKKNLMNMDGIEWKREKWSYLERQWLYFNEFSGSFLANHLIADHPEIARHLNRYVAESKITTIPYGAEVVTEADAALLTPWQLTPKRYAIVIARPEPENSILPIVRAFSQKKRGYQLAVLGNYTPETNPYHREVVQSASDEVRFLGAIYDIKTVQALRYYARLYLHGHTVGGTNPSLVEALGAGNAVVAHDNPFNRWVAGEEAHYFKDEPTCAQVFTQLLDDEQALAKMEAASRHRHQTMFLWEKVLKEYEAVLLRYL